MKINKLLFVVPLVILLFSGCKKDETENPDDHDHEEELITTVTLTFTDAANVQPNVTATFADPDGDGGNGPVTFDTIRLAANTTYNCSVTFWDQSNGGNEDITEEIRLEDDEHIICYDVASANVSVQRTDSDGTYEVGLESQWTVGAASNGSVTVRLKHQPGVKDGTCNPGDTDVEVAFRTEVN